MQLRLTEYDDFLALNKPFSVRTHKVSDRQLGFVEYISEKLNKTLWVVHRLDKETSGLILFAKSKIAAAELSKLFEEHKIKKTYYFLTDKKIEQTSVKITSHIEKQDEFFINNPTKPDNSETDFEFVKKIDYDNEVTDNTKSFYLWKAMPKTGKPHQIRLHAQKAGLNILGDREHAGSGHFRLALHAQKVEFTLDKKNYIIENKAPTMLSLFEDCYYSRHELFDISKNESYRLIHLESDEIRADVFSDRLWVYDYSDKGLSDAEKQKVKNFADDKSLKALFRHMLDRGQGVGGLEKSTLATENTDSWPASEEGVHYLLKTDSGFSPGLFLDQRENRKWVRAHTEGKKVLNLFSYTSGLSVNAALGAAAEVTSVDVSKKFLEWSRENFKLNGLNTENYEFFAQDTMVFLKGSVKRGRKWSLIICDPPSFGRSLDGHWKLEQNLPELASLLMNCLEKKGQILFTCNLEKRSRPQIIDLFCKNLNRGQVTISDLPQLSLDYECTDEVKNLMKGFLLTRN